MASYTETSQDGRRVLVTGGFGFVGAHLCRQLVDTGSTVAVLDNGRLGKPQNLPDDVRASIRRFDCDVRHTDLVTDAFCRFEPEVVIHLAAIHFIPLCNAFPKMAVDVNVAGTQAVLDACRDFGRVEGIVFASSGAVYAPSSEALSEESLLGPTDIYGLTKLWGEQLLALERRKHGLGIAVARLFNVYGPCETNPHFIPVVLQQARRGEELRLGNVETRRDYVFTEDVAAGLRAMAMGMTSDTELTCNLGTGQATAGTEILDCVGRAMGRELIVRQDTARLRASDRPVLLSDPSAAQQYLKWSPRTRLEDGLAIALQQPLAVGVEVA